MSDDTELVFQYNSTFCYDEFLETVGPALQEFAEIPEDDLWEEGGPFHDLLVTPQMEGADRLFRSLDIGKLDECTNFIFSKEGPFAIICDWSIIYGGQSHKVPIGLYVNCSIRIEPAEITGQEIAIF